MSKANGAANDVETDDLRFTDIPSCIKAFATGSFLIILDAPTRENEGDLVIAARHLSPAKAAFLIRHSSGYLCAPLAPARAAALDLPPMVPPAANADPNRTAYTVTVDAAAPGMTTGISAHDRALTARTLGDERAARGSFRRPGHVVPLVARAGGVRERMGHTEAAWEFARLAGVEPAVAVIGEMVEAGEEVVRDGVAVAEVADAGMMRGRGCLEFGRRFGIPCCTIEALKAWVVEKEGELGGESDEGDGVRHPAVNGDVH